MDPNPVGAVIGGFIGALSGAIVWTGVTIVLMQELGLAAIAIGFITALFVRKLGKGTTNIYGLIGAFFTFFGCILGKILTVIFHLSRETGISFLDTLMDFDLGVILPMLEQTIQKFDYLFLAAAVFTGYLYSTHKGKQMHFRRR